MCFGSLLCFLVFLAKVPQMKKYYIVLSIVNKSPSDVTLSYLKNGQIMEQDIKGNATIRISVTITSSKQPDDVGFKVFQKGTNSPMVINGSDSLIVRPMENATTNLVVVNDGTFCKRYFCFSQNIYLSMIFTNMAIPSFSFHPQNLVMLLELV